MTRYSAGSFAHRIGLCLLLTVIFAGCNDAAPPREKSEAIADAGPQEPVARPKRVARKPRSKENATVRQFASVTAHVQAPIESAPQARLTSVKLPAAQANYHSPEPVLPALVNPAAPHSDYSAGPSASNASARFVLDENEAARHSARVSATVDLATDSNAQSPVDTESFAEAPPAVLPWGPSKQTSELTAVSQRAEETVRNGFNLAERVALYTARSQFIEALRTLAAALDAQRNTQAHCRALAAGLTALEEVDDFVPQAGKVESNLNLQLIVDAHRTPVLKNRPLKKVTALEAKRIYLTYAQEQLAAAGGDQPVASLALYGLGKVCTAPAALHGPRDQLGDGKAVVLYQAALIVAPENFMAANELGVLLAKFGRFQEAQTSLAHAAALSNSPIAWRNLGVVCQRAGDEHRAAQAKQQANLIAAQLQQAGQTNAGAQYPVKWVDPSTFAQSHSALASQTDPTPASSTSASATPTQPTPATAAQPESKPNGWKWPWQ